MPPATKTAIVTKVAVVSQRRFWRLPAIDGGAKAVPHFGQRTALPAAGVCFERSVALQFGQVNVKAAINPAPKEMAVRL